MPDILDPNEIKWELVDSEGYWHFPDGRTTIVKAIDYVDKGWTIVNNDKIVSIRDLEELYEKDTSFHSMTAGCYCYARVYEFIDEDNKTFYFRLENWHGVNLM